MPVEIQNLDISKPLLAAQKFKANQLSIGSAEQNIKDRTSLRNLRQKMVTENSLGSAELDEMFTIDPQNAMAVSQSIAKINQMNNPKSVISELQKNRVLQGFAQVSKDEKTWNENLKFLTKNGIKAEDIGEFSENNRALLLGITGKVSQAGTKKLTELNAGTDAEGNVLTKKAIVDLQTGESQDVGEPGISKFKPRSKVGSGAGKTSDANFFKNSARGFFGSTKNPLTGEFSVLDPTTEAQAARLAQTAAEIFQQGGGKINQNDAWAQAVKLAENEANQPPVANQQTLGSQTAPPAGGNDQLQLRQFLDNL